MELQSCMGPEVGLNMKGSEEGIRIDYFNDQS